MSLLRLIKTVFMTVFVDKLKYFVGLAITSMFTFLLGGMITWFNSHDFWKMNAFAEAFPKLTYVEWQSDILNIHPTTKPQSSIMKWPDKLRKASNFDIALRVKDTSLEPIYSEGTILYGTPCTIPLYVSEKTTAKVKYIVGFSQYGKDRFALLDKAKGKTSWYYRPLNETYIEKYGSSIPLNTNLHSCFKVLSSDSTKL
jgi:hypothetical protein